MKSALIQNNFTSGELDPLAHGRYDLEQRKNGAAALLNCIPIPQGGVRRRPGLRFIAEQLPTIALLTDSITVTVPNGGTPPSPDDDPRDPYSRYRDRCVPGHVWLRPDLQAKDAQVGDLLTVIQRDWSVIEAPIESITPGREHCYRVVSASGAVLECSRTTPFTLRESTPESEVTALPGAMMGRDVLVEQPDGLFVWEAVVETKRIGEFDVFLIAVGDRSYAAGLDPLRRVVSHNIINKLPQ